MGSKQLDSFVYKVKYVAKTIQIFSTANGHEHGVLCLEKLNSLEIQLTCENISQKLYFIFGGKFNKRKRKNKHLANLYTAIF